MKYLACLSRLGSKSVKGPVTGKKWIIHKTGDWVDDEDAPGIVGMKISFYCMRRRENVTIQPFFYANPTEDAIKRLGR